MWKKPIKISRLPSFGFSGSDFNQIPTIFSGYTAESEDSSSSEMSDDSRTYSKSTDDNEEIDQANLSHLFCFFFSVLVGIKSLLDVIESKIWRFFDFRKG